jgi:hypothetical protein
MLGALTIYVLSENLARVPSGQPRQQEPAASER